MNRADLLAKIDALMEKRREIMEASWERWDALYKFPAERLEALQYSDGFTPEERQLLEEIDEKYEGLQHMLDEGFFAAEQSPKDKPEWVKAALY